MSNPQINQYAIDNVLVNENSLQILHEYGQNVKFLL